MKYSIKNEIILQGRRDNQAWFEPRMTVIPHKGKKPEVFVIVTFLTGSDIGPDFFLKTTDLGSTWTPPALPRQWQKILTDEAALKKRIRKPPILINGEALESLSHIYEYPKLGPLYHKKTNRLIALGHTQFSQDSGKNLLYKDEHHVSGLSTSPAFSIWNAALQDFTPWQRIEVPEKLVSPWKIGFYCAGQSHECRDGTIIMPCICAMENSPLRVGSVKCKFDGKCIAISGFGKPVGTDVNGGVHEPSLVELGGRYLMTIRSESKDFKMYHAVSEDGLNWEGFGPWCWDDGTPVETENTQQHWLKHDKALYLIYTRKSKFSNGVFRSRAPLWIAEVDVETLRLIRKSERIVFPEKRARTCNFCVAGVTSDEAWVISGERLEGKFAGVRKGMRFYLEGGAINYNQYIGDLLLARII